MAPSSRDRISVDLRGLKAALFDRAEALGVSPSGLVRSTLAEALGSAMGVEPSAQGTRRLRDITRGSRVRLCLRLSPMQATNLHAAAQRAGMSCGDYIAGLAAGVPVLATGGSRIDCIAALRASSAELATLSRNIHRLTSLLRQGDVEPARQYRAALDAVAGDVRLHLEVAAAVLADLQAARGGHRAAPAPRA